MRAKDIIGIGLSIITIMITLTIFYLRDPGKISPTTIIISVATLLISFIGVIIITIRSNWNNLSSRVDKNKKEISEINKSIKLQNLYNTMEKRVSILERLMDNKKAQFSIDPQYIYWIILLILLFLLLRSAGFI
jgi:quinol-cytochrome oxidoreductase complex cytochrome b subunit